MEVRPYHVCDGCSCLGSGWWRPGKLAVAEAPCCQLITSEPTTFEALCLHRDNTHCYAYYTATETAGAHR